MLLHSIMFHHTSQLGFRNFWTTTACWSLRYKALHFNFIMQLDCVAQNYAWGTRGEQSSVARFKVASDETFIPSAEECYAELWYV